MAHSSAWRVLSNYESQDLIRVRYQERFQRTLSAGAAKECRSSMTQARSYYESARDADRTVKPLLLYYGSLGLARALVQFLTGRREATLAPSHGLSAEGWHNTLSAALPDIGLIETSILNKGTFAEFLAATDNISLLTHNRSRPNLAYNHGPIVLSRKVTLLDILSRIPELGEYFVRWKGLPNYLPVDLQAESACSNAWFNSSLHGVPVDTHHVQNFLTGLTFTPILQTEQPRIWYKVGISFRDLPQLWDHREKTFGNIGDLVFLRGFDLSKPAAVLALSYMLGMLVRYFPTHWMGLIRNETSDSSLPTILAAIDFVEEAFPQLVLELFERDKLTGAGAATRS